ncbi:MAG: hypothetical protein K9K39_09905 [Desulfohalobiaceae bacterium]|nr:hypothetical protein [Desulfohalobiaceae bacterium]
MGLVEIAEFEQAGYVGKQELLLAQPLPLDNVNEPVEVEDFRLVVFQEKNGVPVGGGLVRGQLLGPGEFVETCFD